jgi:two-component system, chemotaxis family, chemotaxis protein CheY
MRIMIVDDSAAMRMIVKRTLRQAGFEGHEISEAEDGVKALAAIETLAPDLVLSDWNMPNMTGIELLEKLAAAGAKLKFGFVTTEATADMRTRATTAGAKFLISKPFTPESFKQALGPHIG